MSTRKENSVRWRHLANSIRGSHLFILGHIGSPKLGQSRPRQTLKNVPGRQTSCRTCYSASLLCASLHSQATSTGRFLKRPCYIPVRQHNVAKVKRYLHTLLASAYFVAIN